MNNETTNQTDKLKTNIIDAINKYHPETVNQLIEIVQKQTSASTQKITNSLIELETEDKLIFAEKTPNPNDTPKKPQTLKKADWYWATLTLISVAIVIFSLSTLSLNSSYLLYLRYTFAFILVLFLPGFTFIKLLFGSKMPFNSNTKTDYIELIGLSIGISIILVPMVGLALNYTTWGIGFESLTVSLLALTAIFASGAVLREYVLQ